MVCFLFFILLGGGRGDASLDKQQEPGEHLLACEPEPGQQSLLANPPVSTPDFPCKVSPPDDNTKSLNDSLLEDGKPPVAVTTVSVSMGNTRGGLSSSTFHVKAVEGKLDGATLSESTSKTLDLSTVSDNGEETSVVQALSSNVDVIPMTGEGGLLINGSTTNAVGMTTSHGQQSAAVMKDVLSSTTEVKGSRGVRGVANHSLNTATLGREGLVSVMQETTGLTSQATVPEDGAEPNVNATTWRSVGMAIGTLDKDGASLNATNLNSTYAYQRRNIQGSNNYTALLMQYQQQIKDLRYKLRRCKAQQGGPVPVRG